MVTKQEDSPFILEQYSKLRKFCGILVLNMINKIKEEQQKAKIIIDDKLSQAFETLNESTALYETRLFVKRIIEAEATHLKKVIDQDKTVDDVHFDLADSTFDDKVEEMLDLLSPQRREENQLPLEEVLEFDSVIEEKGILAKKFHIISTSLADFFKGK